MQTIEIHHTLYRRTSVWCSGVFGRLLASTGSKGRHAQHWSATLRTLVHADGRSRQWRWLAGKIGGTSWTIHTRRRISRFLRGEVCSLYMNWPRTHTLFQVSETWDPVSPYQREATRTNTAHSPFFQLDVLSASTTLGLRRFSVSGPRLWNELPHDMRQCNTLPAVKISSQDISLPPLHGQVTPVLSSRLWWRRTTNMHALNKYWYWYCSHYTGWPKKISHYQFFKKSH